jgi:predicted metal-dependent phosphoesterase TrpH
VFDTFDALRAARVSEDRRILRYVDALDEARIAGMIKYRRVSSPEDWRRRWRIGSTTRPITAARSMRS